MKFKGFFSDKVVAEANRSLSYGRDGSLSSTSRAMSALTLKTQKSSGELRAAFKMAATKLAE